MSTIDPIAILTNLDRPVPPRPEFAEALLARLLEQLRAPVAGAERGRRRRLDWFLPGVPRRLRLVLALMALLLLLAGIATATYLSVHRWVSAGPRGIQYSSAYKLSTVFTPPDETAQQAIFLRFRFWSAFTLDSRGHDLYALHRPAGARLPELVRIRGVDQGTRLSATRVLDLSDLAGPRFQPAWRPRSDADSLAVAANGDIFLLAAGRDPARLVGLAGGDAAIFVLHPDGTRQRVLGLGELVRSGVLPNAPGGTLLALVATAPDRLWLRTGSFERPHSNLREGSYRFLEIVDPNADGNWSDRVARPIVLPRAVSFGRGSRSFWSQLTAEPPLPGDDRARSVLSTAESVDGRSQVYRIADFDDDGDALDRGEVRMVFERRHGGGIVALAPTVVRAGAATRRVLVVAGLTFDRISLVSESGAVRDIARSFPDYLGAVLSGPDGDIYPVTEGGIVYRLRPAGPRAHTGRPVPGLAAISAPALPAAYGMAQILFSTPAPASVGIKDAQGPLYAVGADGRGLRKLPHGAAQCFSTDGRMIAFTSDAEVPYEPALYVANSDGSHVRRLKSYDSLPMCPFSTPVLWIWGPHGPVRYDLRTGHEIGPAPRLPGSSVLSPDRTRAVYLGGSGAGPRRHRPLVLLDLSTLRRRRLVGRPVPAGSPGAGLGYWTYGIGWSPDGTRIAYVTVPGVRSAGPGRRRYELWVRDAASGAVLFSTSVVGSMPTYTWSPDSASLLLCVDDHSEPYGFFSCTGGAPVPPSRAGEQPPARLFLVRLADRSTRLLTRDPLVFAAWAPASGTLAYATPDTLFIRMRDGRTTKLAEAPAGRWPGGGWLGWSPDGRYIGLSRGGADPHWKLLPLTTVEVRTGRVRTIRTPPRAGWATWWRR